jgi:Fe-S cluster assembly protein SufD
LVRAAKRRARIQTPSVPYTRADVEALSSQKNEPDWLAERRLAAWDLFEAMPWPTMKDEAWRRTDYRHLRWREAALRHSVNGAALTDIPAGHRAPLTGDRAGGLIAQVGDRTVSSAVAEELAAAGVIFTDLDTAVRAHGDLVREHFMTTAVLPGEGKFAALHAALWTHGVFLYIPCGARVTLPLHSVMWAPQPGATLGHVLIVVEPGAKVTYLHEYASPTLDQHALYVGATELIVKEGAKLRFISLQEWGKHTFAFTHHRARVACDAQLDWIVSAMGGRLSKDFLEVELDGEGGWARMSGLYFVEGNQLIDLDTQQNHNALRTTSDLLFKGALKDKGRSVWQGMIHVLPGAQKADGFQANRNLLLSKKARADSIPGLEIEANDVRCTHAATLGQLEEEPIFYLMSRGIPRPQAERLLVDGFFAPIMDRIPFDGVRARLLAAIDARLDTL